MKKLNIFFALLFIGYISNAQTLTGTTNAINTFLGISAGNTTLTAAAEFNTAIGLNAGNSITTGDRNAILGSNAGRYITTATGNAILGHAAGRSLVTGRENVIIGYASGFTSPTASFNTYVGNFAGAYTLGDGNSFLGASINMAVSGTPTSTFCTLLGARATTTISGLTNATAIGYYAKVSASNAMILGDSTVNVGIGVTAPRAKLEVKGAVIIGSGFQNGAAGFPGIASSPSTYNLYVSNGIITEKVTIAGKSTTAWSDFVFEKGYKLKSLNQVNDFIKKNGHLPEVPSANEVKKNGMNLAENDAMLLMKIEELTLYLIEQDKKIKKMEAIISKLKN